MPSKFIRLNEAFDLPLMIEISTRLGCRAVPGGILGRDELPSGTQRLVASAFFDGDRRAGGDVPPEAVRRVSRSEINEVISDSWLANLADIACS